MCAYFPFWSLFHFFLKTIFSLWRMSSTKWTETLAETSGSLALCAPAKTSQAFVPRFVPSGHGIRNAPPETGSRTVAGLALLTQCRTPALSWLVLGLCQLPHNHSYSGPSQASRHGKSGSNSFWPSNLQLPSLPQKSEMLLLEWFRKRVCAPKTKDIVCCLLCLFCAMEPYFNLF